MSRYPFSILAYPFSIMYWVLAAMMVACTSDDGTTSSDGWQTGESKLVTVGLRITSLHPWGETEEGSTRAWQDSENANDNEMMNIWTVVVVNAADNKVQAIHACKPTGGTKPEVDDYVNLPSGIYRFYSFANMAPSVVMQLLGINGTGATNGTVTRADGDAPDNNNNPTSGNNEDPTSGDNVSPYSASNGDNIMSEGEDNTVYSITFEDGAVVTADYADAVTVNLAGNGFDPDAAENGYGAKGIPMSNVQTKEISGSVNFDLIVVRMMAKIKLLIKNETGSELTVNRATLSNVTQNGNGILKLLPSLTQHDTMEPTHGDIRPNMGTATQDNFTVAVGKTIANDATEEVTFYVNESATPANSEGLFYLTLEVDNGGASEFRYALVSNDNSEWNYIARNDYRIIPIVLDNLKFEIIPYDFPPIGVYPVSVKEADVTNHVYDFQFHDYGHFHLLPKVTKGGAAVEFSATTPTSGSDYKWTLINNDFAQSWFTAASFGDASWMTASQVTATGFYRNQTATADGDEVGGEPYWYVNDGVAGPQWDPDGTGYRPFIFGYIADPEAALGADRKIYHEMRIQVYNGTTAYRQMLYRFYMTLSAEQMLYAAPAKGLSAHRRSHFER